MIYIDQTGETYQDLWDLFGSYLQYEDEYTAIPMLQDLTSELFPDIDMPTIMVITQYDGAGPEEVEESVTDVLEGQLSGVSGIQEMTSQSSEGYSLITLEFKWGGG